LELASYYNGLGVPTSVIQRSAQVLREVDADVANALSDALRKRGVDLYLETQLTKVSRSGHDKVVHFMHRGESKQVQAEEIIYALGRQPASHGLGLDRAGVILNNHLLTAGPDQRSSVSHIFAAGDVCGPHEVVHTAIEQATIAARNAARLLGRLPGDPEEINYRLKLFAVFTHPQVALVGLTEREAREQGIECHVASYPFADHGKSMVIGCTEGFVKLLAESKTGRLIGGACIGPDASELIHEVVVAMRFSATAAQLGTTPHYHPTLSEIWTYPADELAELCCVPAPGSKQV
jgi:pyruvate/2-oxoglutarate dehydrogenase complex dihydrolipoamide dehydrogenase (E3) component